MNARRILLALAVPCLAAGLAGCLCRGTAKAPVDSTKFTVGNTERFSALDARTDAEVSCTGLQEHTLPDGRLEVVANLRNLTASAVTLQIGCDFLDDQGESTGPLAWKALVVPADATAIVRFEAPNAAVRRYAIKARDAR